MLTCFAWPLLVVLAPMQVVSRVSEGRGGWREGLLGGGLLLVAQVALRVNATLGTHLERKDNHVYRSMK